MSPSRNLKRVSDTLWELPRQGAMRVPGRVYASEELMAELRDDPSLDQVRNVATLPGIVGYSLAMPDIHWGYGFPIGGVAAFDPEDGGVISPGGVGFDINCGVRLLAVTGVKEKKVREHRGELGRALLEAVPAGTGRGGPLKLKAHELDQVGRGGARWAVERGFGGPEDLLHCEEGGCAAWADPEPVSADARIRGYDQLGTLGSGNHFLEVQAVEELYDAEAAARLGIDAITVLIHTGSRGFGHQVCDDFLETMQKASKAYGIELADRQLCAAPFLSPEGQAYFGAMGAAMNFAFANRQLVTHRVREVLARMFGERAEARVVYDVCHNIAKRETHAVGGRERELVVHRKGATRAFGPGHPMVPEAYRALGQPVLVPGDMGRYSYVLLGTARAGAETFGSCCHGAGRRLSRNKARAAARGRNIKKEMAARGVSLQAASLRGAEEEISDAYKDVADVVDVVVRAGLARPVARLRPFAVVKG
ncbi:MAG: RtcB family protein [Planctomycetota bacterium]|nr:MAG: RtcB family protein [Planctomycetota bacterium]